MNRAPIHEMSPLEAAEFLRNAEAQVWLTIGRWVDFSIAANRERFVRTKTKTEDAT